MLLGIEIAGGDDINGDHNTQDSTFLRQSRNCASTLVTASEASRYGCTASVCDIHMPTSAEPAATAAAKRSAPFGGAL